MDGIGCALTLPRDELFTVHGSHWTFIEVRQAAEVHLGGEEGSVAILEVSSDNLETSVFKKTNGLEKGV
jgi:hypothetical protein